MIAPVMALEEAGALITLASDTKSHDLFQSMRMAIAVARIRGAAYQITARTVLGWAITNGAAALGLGGVVGALAEGMKADVVVLDAREPGLRPIVDGFGIVVHSGVGANVETVLVDGRIVLDERRPTRFDAADVVNAAQAVASRLWRESGWAPVVEEPPA
jgi:5-methylthioadenosine/S-adenosylhomocysteine deaminase